MKKSIILTILFSIISVINVFGQEYYELSNNVRFKSPFLIENIENETLQSFKKKFLDLNRYKKVCDTESGTEVYQIIEYREGDNVMVPDEVYIGGNMVVFEYPILNMWNAIQFPLNDFIGCIQSGIESIFGEYAIKEDCLMTYRGKGTIELAMFNSEIKNGEISSSIMFKK